MQHWSLMHGIMHAISVCVLCSRKDRTACQHIWDMRQKTRTTPSSSSVGRETDEYFFTVPLCKDIIVVYTFSVLICTSSEKRIYEENIVF